MAKIQAEVTVKEMPDGTVDAEIEYADGHTVRLKVQPDSIVLKMHLGIPRD